MAKTYNVKEGGLHDKFLRSRAKLQIFAGGFGNGKTAGMCIKCLNIAKRYPGANILMARSTYPKLNDTLRKEFLSWTPADWIKRRPSKDDNTLIMKNGTTINFRYISQQGKASEDGTTSSNLLSATYDAIFIDQMEDPEIGYKDFIDLFGRLRGATRCIDTSDGWPDTGPRMMFLSANPTRNWFYKKIIRPMHVFAQTGQRLDDLIVHPQTGEPLAELFEGSTYENKHNLAEDFLIGLESTYKGQMKSRYLMGKWEAYEGLVYPSFDYSVHMIEHEQMVHLFKAMRDTHRFTPSILEGYDYGLSRPSCYIYAFTDQFGNVHCLDGFHRPETSIPTQAIAIDAIRRKYGNVAYPHQPIIADPAIFKRASQSTQVVGRSVAAMFSEDQLIEMMRGTNDIVNGITKVTAYLEIDPLHRNPYTRNFGAPRLYLSTNLDKVADEFGSYYWKRDTFGEPEDKPIDKDDHGMDTLKYMLSLSPMPAVPIRDVHNIIPTTWMEHERKSKNPRGHRYG